ncbi:MAG TPA: hypothetical protein VFE57_03080 [Cyclobacteriaceae bacterium]|nr:hypothetical protein [Cyclobacteriaceae bacterium]
MNIFLRLKHWQLFSLLIGIPLIFQIIFIVSIFTSQRIGTAFIFLPVIVLIALIIHFGWHYALGTNLYKKLPAGVDMNLTLFKVFLFFPVVYILIFCAFISLMVLDQSNGGSPNPTYLFAILPFHFAAIFCMFYLLYFTSKSLKSVELQRAVTFNDYAGEFFLLWFFPIGIWLIQPRVNALFDTTE